MSKSLMVGALAVALLSALTACQKSEQAVASAEQSSQISPSEPTVAQDGDAKQDFAPQVEAYKAWVQEQMALLLTDTEQFVLALKAGDVAQAKALYPKARMPFERSEPIAEIFEDLDPRIDNREADLETGEAWTGFHAIEKILWQQNTTAGTEQLAEQLLADIQTLKDKIPNAQLGADDMIEGAVDLLNEISTSKITGEEEIFSKTDLYDFQANVEGAQKIFEIFKPELVKKDAQLVETIQTNFDAVYALLAKYRVGEDYRSYDSLSANETRELGEAIHKLGEPLAQMGQILAN